jgi:hypothetical protein
MHREYGNGIKTLQLEKEKICQEAKRKPRRKIPKPGCYPLAFSEFTMKRVSSLSCTITLSDLRKDLSALSEVAISVPGESGHSSAEVAAEETQRMYCGNVRFSRECRRKLSRMDCLPPRSSAEEQRQIEQVLRKSKLQQPYAMPGEVSFPKAGTCGASSRSIGKVRSVKSEALNHGILASRAF